MKKSIAVFFLCCKIVTYGQVNTKLSLIQGVWQHWIPNETGDHAGSIFKIVDGVKCLEFTYMPDADESNHALFKMIVGFQDSVSSSDDIEELDTADFKANGLYYTEIINEKYIDTDGLVERPNFMIPSYFECDGQVLSMNGTKLFEYDKIPELPYQAIEYLYHRGKRDTRNYLNEYLDLKVLAIKPLKCAVYSKPDKQTNVQLTRDNIVVIIEETEKWLKVKYGESSIGWIKRAAVRQ